MFWSCQLLLRSLTCNKVKLRKIIVILSGATPANSKINIMLWFDNLVTRHSDVDSLVYDCGGNRLHGCYHHLKQDQHSLIEADLTTHNQWHQQCTTGNISAGFFVSIEGAGRANALLLTKGLGHSSAHKKTVEDITY